MDYIKIRFGNDFECLDPRFEEIFRSMNPMFTLSERIWEPQMDIYETRNDIFILAEMAGVNKENLEIEISSKAVRIHGKRPEALWNKGTYRLAEIQYGKFERTLFLPVLIDMDKVTASFLDGILNIRLAKMPRETRKIPISD